MINKNIEKIDISKYFGSLNFAYCPSQPLKLNEEIKNNTNEYKELSKQLNEQCKKYLSDSMRYFYICYSIKINEYEPSDINNYFYFQLFSQIGMEQTAAKPIYGFFSYESIVETIKNIDSMFESKNYDKLVFDTVQIETSGSVEEIINLMQEWTSTKLSIFNELYFIDESAIENLHNLIKHGKKLIPISNKKNNTKQKTIKETKNTNIKNKKSTKNEKRKS